MTITLEDDKTRLFINNCIYLHYDTILYNTNYFNIHTKHEEPSIKLPIKLRVTLYINLTIFTVLVADYKD